MKSLTVRELITGNAKELSPMDYDTSEIRALSNSLPSNGQIDLNVAEVLAAKFLRGADLCSELLAIATSYAIKCETEKKKAYSNAALIKAAAAGIKTDKSKCLFAEGDEDYIQACNKHGESLAFVKWISGKYDSFNKAHFLCKQMLTRGYSHEKAAGFSADPERMVKEVEENQWESEGSDQSEAESEWWKET